MATFGTKNVSVLHPIFDVTTTTFKILMLNAIIVFESILKKASRTYGNQYWREKLFPDILQLST